MNKEYKVHWYEVDKFTDCRDGYYGIPQENVRWFYTEQEAKYFARELSNDPEKTKITLEKVVITTTSIDIWND